MPRLSVRRLSKTNVYLNKKLFKWSLCCALIPFLLSCNPGERVFVLKLGHGLDPSHSVHKAMVFMAERVQEESNGQIRIDIYPSD